MQRKKARQQDSLRKASRTSGQGLAASAIPKGRRLLIAFIAAIEIGVLALSYYASSLGIFGQWALALLSLLISGALIKSAGGLQGWGFLYLIGSRKGLSFIDELSTKGKRFWSEMAIWGIVLSFGLLSYPFLKSRISKRSYAFGMVSLIVIMFFVLPYLSVAVPFIQIPQLQSALASAQSAPAPSFSYISAIIDAVSVVAGFAGYIFFALLYNSFLILNGVAVFASGALAGNPQISALTSQVPGVAPIIPGIDIPLFAGVISLAILLVVHEFSHGVLSRVAKVKLKSIGLVLVGIIPMGAFVEPDEKGISKLDSTRQTKIFSAGMSANFVAMLVFFVLMVALLYAVLPGITTNLGIFVSGSTQGYPAYNSLQEGMHVLYWNGHSVSTLADLENASKGQTAGSKVSVVTDKGTFNFTAAAAQNSTRGIIGVGLYQKEGIKGTAYAGAVYFLYTVFALSFMLNFLVAVVNLLPIPGFDGWRIYKTNIKSARFVNFLTAVVIISLVINVMQWAVYI